MKSVALSLAVLFALSSTVGAGRCRVVVPSHSVSSHQAVVVQQGFVAVPFAVPVAVPSYVNYVAPQAYYGMPASSPREPADPQDAVKAQEAPAGSLVAKHCAACHDGSKPDRVVLTGDLDCETRLKAIGKMLHDDDAQRMPKGKTLSAEDLGLLIQELSAGVPQSQAGPQIKSVTPASEPAGFPGHDAPGWSENPKQ